MSRLGPLALHTNVTGTADSNPLSVAGLGTAAFQVTGTSPGTMVVQATIALGGVAPSDWITIRSVNMNSMAQAASITANGLYVAAVGGFTHMRVSITGAATAATVRCTVVDASLADFLAGTGGGGGGGAVTITDGVNASYIATVFNYTNSKPIAVSLRDTNGDAISVGGGTQYTEDAVSTADPVGNMLLARRRDTLSSLEVNADGDNIALNSTSKGELYVKDTLVGNNTSSILVDTSSLNLVIGVKTDAKSTATDATSVSAMSVLKQISASVQAPPSQAVTNAGTFAVQDSEKIADNAGFTDGTTKLMPAGFVYDEVAGTGLTENDIAAPRIDIKRASVSVLEDATTRGQRAAVSAGGALKVDNSAVTQPVSGTVTANIGSSGSLALDATLTGGTQKTKLVDSGGTNVGTIKAASTAAVAADPALVVAISPNNTVAATQSGTWNVNAAVSGTVDTELPSASGQGDGTSNPTVPVVGAFNSVFNGTTWDRQRSGGGTGSAAVGGTVATNVAITANPVNLGAQGVSAENTVVTATRQVQLVADLVGKLIVLPYANPENFVSGAITTAMTGTTSTSLVAAPAAGLRNYITQITVSNAHATVGTDVIIQDGSGGTTLYTIPASAVYGGAVITFPTPLRQPTTAMALYCANVTTGASTKVSASGYKGV